MIADLIKYFVKSVGLISSCVLLHSTMVPGRAFAQPKTEALGIYFVKGGQWFGLVPLRTPYEYQLTGLQLSYGHALSGSKHTVLDLVSELNAGLVRFGEPKGPPWKRAGEFGMAFGLRAGALLNGGRTMLHSMFLLGPHHISDSPNRQAPGFVINSAAFTGVMMPITYQSSIDLRLGWRHLSNAGIREPNGGTNTIMVQVGFVFTN